MGTSQRKQKKTGERDICSEMTGNEIFETIRAVAREGADSQCFKELRSDKALAAEVAKFLIKKVKKEYELSWLYVTFTRDRFFGPEDWKKYFGIELPKHIYLPVKIEELTAILESPCPFVQGKKVKETHYLFYLPVDFNGEPLTIGKWQEMFPHGSQPKFYRYMNVNAWYKDYGFAKMDTARFSWFLMFEGVIPGTESKTWDEQLALKSENYDVPKLIEVTPMHFLVHKKNDGQRINENIWGRTCDVDSDGDHVRAGNFDGDGFGVCNRDDSYRNSDLGLFLFRKLS